MSSHHIVRDEQEPALLLLDHQNADDEVISNLLEWSPTVITSSQLVEKFTSYGFKVDVVLCPVDELDYWKNALLHHSPIKLLTYNEGDNLIETAIYYLRSLKYSALNAIITDFEETALDSLIAFLQDLDIIFYQDGYKWHYCKDGFFSKWVPFGKFFRLFDASEIKMSLEGEISNFEMKNGFYEALCQQEGMAKLQSNGAFWLGEGIK